jgi:hypothetical protein
MRNPKFELPCRVRSLARGFSGHEGEMKEGWMVSLELTNGEGTIGATVLKVFIPNAVLEVDRLIGTRPNEASVVTIQQRPAVRAGDVINLELNLPVLDE